MEADPRIGQSYGPFRVESLLGQGGMGVVYRAYDERLDRRVALKVLAPGLTDESFKKRFVRESQMAAATDHPNIIPIYEAGEDKGSLFIAMRYVEGSDLRAIITEQGALDGRRAMAIVGQVASALDAAHSLGLIHRDVKPANILVSSRNGLDHVYLTDFGVSKHSSSKTGLTGTGEFIGTIDYIAPEQIEGRAVDSRSDVYSLGCVLYECLTGTVPFDKDTDVATMYAHLSQPPPRASGLNGSLPATVDDVIEKALAKSPDERFESCGEMMEAVEAALEGKAVVTRADTATTTVSPRVSISRPGVIVAALAVALLVGFLFTRMSGSESPADPGPGNKGSAGAVRTGAIRVAPEASDDGAGTADEPMSLAGALRQAGPGTIVELEPGTYETTENVFARIERGGDAVNPLVITAADPAAVPELTGPAEGLVFADGVSNVRLQGLEFSGFATAALALKGTTSEIHLESVEAHDGGYGLLVHESDGLVVEGSSFGDLISAVACIPGPCDGLLVSKTEIHDNNQGLVLAGGGDTEIRDTTLVQNDLEGLNYFGDGVVTLANLTVADNGKVRSADAIAIAVDDFSSATVEIYNTILASNRGIALHIGSKVQVARLDFNLFYLTSDAYPAILHGKRAYNQDDINHSRFPNRPEEVDEGTYTSMPEFQDIRNENYQLKPGSPGVDEGTSAGASEEDVLGTARPQGKEVDRGAYER